MPETKVKSKTPHYRVDSYNPDDKKIVELEPVVKFVVDNWETWDSFWSDKFSKFDDYYNRWKNKPPKRDEDWQSQFQKRLTWQAVATLVARYHSILFPISAPIEAEATETQDEGYRIISKSIVAHWFKLGKFIKEFLSGMRSAGIYGTGLFEDDWYVKTGDVMEKVEKEIPDFRSMVDQLGNKILDEQGNIRSEQIGMRKIITEQSKKKVIEDRYRVKKTSIFAWRIHPHKKDDDDDYPVIKQEFVNYDDLLKMEQRLQKYGLSKFENLDKIKEDSFKVNEKEFSRIQKDEDFKDKKNPRIELLIYWGLYGDGEDGQKKASWICVVNRKYKLWRKDNPFWHKTSPLTHIVWTEDEKESYYGIGLAEIGADAEDRANTNVNIRIDERKKNIRQGGYYNANDKKIKKSLLEKNVPGLWKPVGDISSVKPDPVLPKSTLDDYKEEEVAVNDHREITGATTALLPPADKSQQPDTLGGMQLNLSQASARLKPDLSMMEIMGIRRIANRAFLMTRQFMTLSQTIELVASEDKLKQLNLQKIYTMTSNQLIGGVNFFCTGLSESLDKMQNIDKALKFMEILQKVNPGNPFIMYLTKKIALWLGMEDAEQFANAMPVIPGMPQGTPQGAIPGANMPQGMPMPVPQGMPPQGGGQPPIPGAMPMPPQGLPPQIMQLIIQRMMQGQGQQPPNPQARI